MTKTAAKRKCGCKGKSGESKRSFSTRRAAVTSAIRTNRMARTYPCPVVKNRWHLTH